MHHDLTNGNITRSLLWFAFPIMVGNLLQQFYNVVDTLIVGQFLGKDALAAVGSSYSLMTFLTSILLGLCMGSGVAFSIYYGKKDSVRLKNSIFLAFCMIGGIALLITGIVFSGMDMILHLLQVPADIYEMMREYLWMIFWGILATFLYNFISCLLRAAGNSVVPLVFLGISAGLNIGLDLLFVDRDLAVCIVGGTCDLHAAFLPGILSAARRYAVEKRDLKRNPPSVFDDLYPAVGDEFRNPDGAGTGQQFRLGCDGGFFRGSEDRLVFLYAGTGFRKCIFHLCSAELRSRKERADP